MPSVRVKAPKVRVSETPLPKKVDEELPKEQSKPDDGSFTAIVGTYERLLYGLSGSFNGTNEITIKPIFIFPAHISCIKTVSASPGGRWLATGSADEIIKVWDLRRRKEIGGLMHHTGSITQLAFPTSAHLLSASEDGTIALFHSRTWEVLRTLSGHKGRVNCMSVHPSGKLFLTVGADKTLRMWDLMRGKGCASTKLGKEGERIRWNASGSLFAISAGTECELYTTEMEHRFKLAHTSRIHDLQFASTVKGSGLLLIGSEDGSVGVFEVSETSSLELIGQLRGATKRVKAIELLKIFDDKFLVATISSDGLLRVYLLEDGLGDKDPIGTYDTKGTRPTSLCLSR